MKLRPTYRLLLIGVTAALISAVFAATALATVVKTEPATEVSATKATLAAEIWPEGYPTLYGFEYGTTTKYGSGTPGQNIAEPPKSSGVRVGIPVEGLAPNTTYHYRVVAGGNGTAYGLDRTFKTAPGLYMTGEASESEALQPALAGTSYPRGISAVQTSPYITVLETAGIPARCTGVSGVGSTINEAVTDFSFYPDLSEGFLTATCEFFEEPATVKMNGCYYTYHVSNAGPPYTGTAGIGCAKAGNAIEIASTACTLKIPAQSAGGIVKYKEVSTGSGSGVSVTTSGTGLAYEKVGGPLCFLLGKTGSFGGAMTLS